MVFCAYPSYYYGNQAQPLQEIAKEVSSTNQELWGFGMGMKERMESKLQAAFAPVALSVMDDSHKHIGHAGARPGGETHFTVSLVADAFAGLSRVQRHRLIYDALADELKERVHALSIDAKSPAEQ